MESTGKLRTVRNEPAEFTKEFTMLYCSFLPKLYNIKCKNFAIDVKIALKKIRKFVYDKENSNSESISEKYSYEETAVRCAYLYAYSVINSGTVYCQFLKYFRQNESIFVELFGVKNLAICCLGGGPGTEAVALIKVIHDKIWKFSEDYPNAVINVHITVVDICEEWMSEESAIITALKNSPNFIHARKVEFEFDFFKVDLLKPFDQFLQDKIRKSNITTIIKVRNEKRRSCIPMLRSMLDNVINSMGDNSCLFMLDTAGGIIFNSVIEVIDNHRSSFPKQEFMHNSYRLHGVTLQELVRVMEFRNVAETSVIFPTLMAKVSSCFWIKKIPV